MRNAEFDREHVLRAAMLAFMNKGYAKTSMQDLTQATGLHPGSLYCAFTNKRGLLLAAIGQYQSDRSTEFERHFSGQQTPLEQLKKYLDSIVLECISCEASKACLLTKALNEMAEQDDELQSIITDNLTRWEQGIAQQFAKAKTQGLLHRQSGSGKSAERDCQALARYFVMGIYGLRTFAHTHPTLEVLQSLADQLFEDVTR
ncbi:TetR/AcrR family transcriptional regulator [Shewanella surugensis]|uniref:TetR/AcrR family transcriptional regulator n=1 Tax=Shewanella surugensis TaxID=212020 RepID=A0ABT0LIJ6_9GAMM|nr:TetR/AcrR family transcriptional regulator [Shewanella surugensis]MCL1127532.1 TetR/AcrR family transcriptional regulator [Shewanella surugensis]